MIKDYLDTLDKDIKNHLYNTSISCIHKAIRMGNCQCSIAPTVIAWNLNKWRFKNRMLICLTEDCCRDYETIKWFSENYLKKIETEEGAIEIVKKMCLSLKGKEGNFCKCGLLDWENEKQIIFNNEQIKKIVDNNIYEAYRLEVPILNLIDFLKKSMYVVPDWMENFLKMCYEMNLDRERQGVLIPVFYNYDKCQTIRDTYDLYSYGADTNCENLFLWNGLDVHTYIGKFALNTAKKKGFFNFIKKDFDDTIWHLMMGNYKFVQKQIDGFCLTKEEKKIYVDDEIENGWKIIFDEYNLLRENMLKRYLPEYIDACKYVFDKKEIVNKVVKYEQMKFEF